MTTFTVKSCKTVTILEGIEPWSDTCKKCGHDELEVRQSGLWITDTCPGHSWWHICTIPDIIQGVWDHCHVKCTKCKHKRTTFRRPVTPPVKPPPMQMFMM